MHDLEHAKTSIANNSDVPLDALLNHPHKNWTQEAKAHFQKLMKLAEPVQEPGVSAAVAKPESLTTEPAPQIGSFIDPLPKVPQQLKDKPNWVLWKLAQVNGKITKIPYKLDFKNAAASTRPEDWSDYKSVAEKIQIAGGITEKQGIGRVVQKEERVVGIDLDGCRDAQTGAITQWAEDIVESLNSYCEITPSQTGLRIWVIGDLPEGDQVFNLDPAVGLGSKVKIEIFTDARYFTVTGQSQFHSPLRERDLTEPYELIKAVRRKHPAPKKSKTSTATATESASVQIEKLGQFDTSKYDIFMRGEITSREPFVIQNRLGKLEYPSQSEGDFGVQVVMSLDRAFSTSRYADFSCLVAGKVQPVEDKTALVVVDCKMDRWKESELVRHTVDMIEKHHPSIFVAEQDRGWETLAQSIREHCLRRGIPVPYFRWKTITPIDRVKAKRVKGLELPISDGRLWFSASFACGTEAALLQLEKFDGVTRSNSHRKDDFPDSLSLLWQEFGPRYQEEVKVEDEEKRRHDTEREEAAERRRHFYDRMFGGDVYKPPPPKPEGLVEPARPSDPRLQIFGRNGRVFRM